MSLKIFGTDPETQPKPRDKFADDVVGRFRSGHQLNKRPVALTEWRVTTGDPEVADAIAELLGGDAPQEWDASGEDKIEVFTATKSVPVILDGPKALRQRMVLWGRNNKIISDSDGETLSTGEPDPDRDLSFQERKAKARDGIGAQPQIDVFFRIKGHEDLGIFKFQTGSWSMAQDLARDDTEQELADYFGDSDGKGVEAVLHLEGVEFTAKNGPRAGQLVSYTKPVLDIKGPVK